MSVRVYFDLPDGVYRQLLPVLDQNQETVNALGRRLMVDHAALVEASGISAVPMRGEPIPRPSRRINPERVQQPRRTADDQGNRHAPHLTREQIASIPVRFVDGGETVRAFWSSAAEVLAMCARGEADIIFPTRRNLERLALFDSFDAALDNALSHPVLPITPFEEERDAERWLCIPEGLGYPVTAERWTGVTRG